MKHILRTVTGMPFGIAAMSSLCKYRSLWLRIIVLLVCTCVPGAMSYVSAQRVGSQEALDIAANYLRQEQGNRAPERGSAAQQLNIAYTAQEGDETYYYVINNGENDGFLIVAGHDAAVEILACGDEGHFDYDSIAPALRGLLDTYQEQIHAVYQDPTLAQQARAGRRNATAARSNVANFMSTTWNQRAPYNLGITGGSNPYPIGCTNTATAQIMKYYNHPAQATNPAMSSLSLGSYTAKAVEANRKLSFSSMSNNYSSSTSYSGANKAVADLMYLIARLNETDFDTDGSGASTYDSGQNMIDYLGYDPSMDCADRDDYTATEWDNMMYAEMSAKRPVLYSGFDTGGDGGHAFILSGYKDGKYYINWGWGSSGGNNYFALNALNISGWKFNSSQEAIFNIKKNAGGRPSATISSYKVNSSTVGMGQILETKITYTSNALKQLSYSWQVKLKNKSTGAITALHQDLNRSMWSGKDETVTVRDTIPISFKLGEQYEVLLYCHNGNGTWSQVSQSTKPVITIGHPVNFKSYSMSNKEVSYGSTPALTYTYSKPATAISIGYDLCAKVTNVTMGTDTLEVLKSDVSTYQTTYYSTGETTLSANVTISGTYRVGDKVKVEAGYRLTGTTNWTYINQTPIELTLGSEIDLLSYELKLSGEQLPSAYLPYSITYTCRTPLRRDIDFGIRYQGLDNSLDSTIVMRSKISTSFGENKTYSYNYSSLSSILQVDKRYKLTGMWRWNDETQWRTFPAGTATEIKVIPSMTFASFSMPKTELASAVKDTISFVYTSLKTNSSQNYKLGLHLKGLTSKIDTIVSINNSFTGTVGNNQTAKVAFTVPGFLWLGEKVKLTGCYKAPNGNWVDIDQSPSTFRVLNCYRFDSCHPTSDSIFMGSSSKFYLKYASLHSFSKPSYYIGLHVHDLTTQVPDTIFQLTSSFTNTSATESGSTYYSYTIPTVYKDGDRIETTLVYRPREMPEWITVSDSKCTLTAITVDFQRYELATTEISRGTSANLKIYYNKPSNYTKQAFDFAVRLTNTTQNRDTLIIMKENMVPYYSYSSTSLSFVVPATFAVGDECKVEAYYRMSETTDWKQFSQEPAQATLAAEMELKGYTIKKSGDLTFGLSLPYEVQYIRRSSLSSPYQLALRYQGIDNPLDTVVVISSSFSGSVSSTSSSNSTGLHTFLKLNKNYRLSMKYRLVGAEEWQDFADGEPVSVHIVPAVTFHSFEHLKSELFACGKDTMTFVYSKVSSYNSLSYTIGARLLGQTSGVDTTVVAKCGYSTSFTGSTGENKTATVNFTLPSTLRVGEQVKVQLCWQEPGEAWVPMVEQYQTFVVKDCYQLEGYTAAADTAQIGSSCSLTVSYRSLTSASKPTYYLGVRLHNLTTQGADEVIATGSSLYSYASLNETSTATLTFQMPSHYNLNDKVQVTALYRPGADGEWMDVPGEPVVFEMKAPKLGLALLEETVANDGYITPKNFEIHLVFKNYLNKNLTRQIDIEMCLNNVYKGDVTCRFTIGANETKDIVITPGICTQNILTTLTTGLDYKFRVYNASGGGGRYAELNTSPILHLIPYGDVTQDGNNNTLDVEAIEQYLLDPEGHPLGTAGRVAADGNADGQITIGDISLLIESQKPAE